VPEGAILWGFNADGDWRPLFQMHGGQIVHAPGNDAPARLTPLVYPQENAAP